MNNATATDNLAAAARARLFDRLASPGMAAPTVPYPPHETVEEGKHLARQDG